MPNITEEMIEEFNAILEEKGSIIRVQWSNDMIGGGVIHITLPKDKFIQRYGLDYAHVNVTDQFYAELKAFFRDKGIEKLHYNNTGNVFWNEGVGN